MFLELNNLGMSFGTRQAVRNLNLSVEQGELVCLLGSSGCGKTTILNMIGGFLHPSTGSVVLDGADITSLAPEERPVATVFQSYGLFPHMSVGKNVAYGLKFQKLGRLAAQERARRYLAMVGLEDYADARIHELSGGQQQRVALARALAVEPKICLLDEPLSNLDAALRISMRTEIRRIQRQTGCTMIFVTHDQEEALSLADRMALLQEGTLVQMAAPLEMLRNPASPYVASFLGIKEYHWENGQLYKRMDVQQ